jgi:hypothetical protein
MGIISCCPFLYRLVFKLNGDAMTKIKPFPRPEDDRYTFTGGDCLLIKLVEFWIDNHPGYDIDAICFRLEELKINCDVIQHIQFGE